MAGDKIEATTSDESYRVYMQLLIREVSAEDFGVYKCVARNSLGETNGQIKLYGASVIEKNHLETFRD